MFAWVESGAESHELRVGSAGEWGGDRSLKVWLFWLDLRAVE